jgi:hypothetical protein
LVAREGVFLFSFLFLPPTILLTFIVKNLCEFYFSLWVFWLQKKGSAPPPPPPNFANFYC